MRNRCLLALLTAALLLAGGTSAFGEEKPGVSLVLSRVSAERGKDQILFQCEAVLDNDTGTALEVQTNFSSVFDGLELVVTTRGGKVLAQQGYTHHQSPFTPPGRKLPLKRGRTSGTLVFPVGDIPEQTKAVKVRLVGTLPGSGYERILSTETFEVRIKE